MRARLLMTMTLILAVQCSYAAAAVRLKDICRVKGQETNSLQGLGLIVGLKGNGDGGRYLPTIRSLATVMHYMLNPAIGGADELRDATNVALGRDVVWCAPAYANRAIIVRNDAEIIRVSLAK